MGYGSRAVDALRAFYNGELYNVDLDESGRKRTKEVYPDLSQVDEASCTTDSWRIVFLILSLGDDTHNRRGAKSSVCQ